MCPEEKSVYKVPIGFHELSSLLALALSSSKGLTQSAFPIEHKLVGRKYYFRFNALHQPMHPMEAKINIVMFVKSVVAAVQELHGFGIAHNDIRLDNICFDENRQAVLIDLDRSNFT